MKLLFLPSYFSPEKAASMYIADNRYEAFAKEGIDMVAYVPYPSRGLTKEEIKDYRRKPVDTLYDGKLVIKHFPICREVQNPFMRIVRYFMQNIKQYRWAKKKKNREGVDLVFVASTPPLHGYMASRISKKYNIPLVYNVQDIFPDSLVGTGLAKKEGLVWKIGNMFENKTYQQASKIIVISEDFKKNLLAKGVSEDKIEVIYNWVDEKAVMPIDNNNNPLFEEFGLSHNVFHVVYAGNLGHAQNIGIVIDAARRLKDKNEIEFLIFGKGGMEDEIKAIIREEKLNNIKVLPLQPYERVSMVYGIGNVCIVACKAGLGGAAMPSKTWSIMSSGRAVLANFDKGELKEIVENNRCGVFTNAGDLDGFVNAIIDLSEKPECCAEMGANGRKFILDNLTREVGTQKYVDVIKSVVKENN